MSVEGIAENLLSVEVERADLDVSEMLLPAERRILASAAAIQTHQRFTVVHELGHWFCLEGRGDPMMCRAEDVGLDTGEKRLEREADAFAAELIVPEETVRVAADLGVSAEVLAWRGYSLGLGEAPT
jgi:Zn-dependent peptidase ImmA (M78 family)